MFRWQWCRGWLAQAATDVPKAVKVSDAEMDAINISRDDFHGEWNYTISPMLAVPDDANRPVAGLEVEA
jgi:hypothetical protein